jgi:hypothetical protein
MYICYSLETVGGILNEIQRSQEDLLRKRALRMCFFFVILNFIKKKSFQDFYVVELRH